MRFTKTLSAVAAVFAFGLTGCNMNTDVTNALNSAGIPGASEVMTAIGLADTNAEYRLRVSECKIQNTPEEFFKSLEIVNNQNLKENYLAVYTARLNACNKDVEQMLDTSTNIINEQIMKAKNMAQGYGPSSKLELARNAAQAYANFKYIKDMMDSQGARIASSNEIKEAIIKNKKLKIGNKAVWKKNLAEYDLAIAGTNKAYDRLKSKLVSLDEGVALFKMFKY